MNSLTQWIEVKTWYHGKAANQEQNIIDNITKEKEKKFNKLLTTERQFSKI